MRALLFFLLLTNLSSGEVMRFTFERGLMGTRFVITTFGENEERARQASELAFAKAEQINAVASDYIPDSELLRLSQVSPGQPAATSPLLFDILVKAREASQITEGRFDPTIGPLTRLWRESRRRGKLPAPAVLAKARAACGWKAMRLDPANRSVTLEKPGMRLDLGGIAKGYAADRMFEILRDQGFPRSCIAAGGDLRLGEAPPGKSGWKVGIRSLDKESTSGELLLSNCGVSTSGDLQQSVVIDGSRYSHVIDPATGLGLTTHLAVTIVADDATASDSFDNAAAVVGAENAGEIARKWGAREVRVAR